MVAGLDRNIFKDDLTVCNSTLYVKTIDLQNEKNKMEKWAYFTIHQNVKLISFILIIDGTSSHRKF